MTDTGESKKTRPSLSREDLQHLQDQVSEILNSGRPWNFPVRTFFGEIPQELERAITLILEQVNRPELKFPLVYCFGELLTNARKAVAKRAFFHIRKLRLDDPEEYSRGMSEFRDSWLADLDYWQEKQEELGYSLQVVFQCRDGHLSVLIANSGSLLPAEQERINKQIDTVRKSLIEGQFTEYPGLDQVEGGGLGLPLVVGMLVQMGAPPDGFSIRAVTDKTVTVLKVPLAVLKIPSGNLHGELAAEIDSLPPFPENLFRIQDLLASNEFNLKELAAEIGKDPALTAALIRMGNSAAYFRGKPVNDIAESVKMIGTRELKNLLYFFGTEIALAKKYKIPAIISNHLYQTAIIARRLCARYAPGARDQVYVGGLLHDLGKLIIYDRGNELMKKIQEYKTDDNVPEWLAENLAFGLDHAELGGLVAERWHFPPEFVAMIRYHHNPSAAPADAATIVGLTYLADFIPSVVRGEIQPYMLDQKVLQHLGINTDEELFSIAVECMKDTSSVTPV